MLELLFAVSTKISAKEYFDTKESWFKHHNITLQHISSHLSDWIIWKHNIIILQQRSPIWLDHLKIDTNMVS